MRTFTCLVTGAQSADGVQSVILAADEQRARELLLRQLSGEEPVTIEIREGGKLVWTETAQPSRLDGA